MDMSSVSKVSFWLLIISVLLGVGCFTTHALTIYFDENTKMVHEPFFFMVIVGYGFSVVSLVSLVVLIGDTIFRWLSRH